MPSFAIFLHVVLHRTAEDGGGLTEDGMANAFFSRTAAALTICDHDYLQWRQESPDNAHALNGHMWIQLMLSLMQIAEKQSRAAPR